MSRSVTSKEAVRAARQELLDRGDPITLRAVVKITGGSNTTVLKFMNEIEQEEKDLLGDDVRVQCALTDLVFKLHRQLQESAEARVAEGQEAAQKVLDAGKADLDELQRENEATNALLSETKRLLEEKSAALEDMKRKNAQANIDMALQAKSLRDLQTANDEFRSQLTAVTDEAAKDKMHYDAYIKSAAEDRRMDKAANKDALDQLRGDLEKVRNQLTVESSDKAKTLSENLTLNRDNERLLGEVTRSAALVRELNSQLRDLELNFDQARSREHTLELARAGLGAQINLLTRQLSDSTSAWSTAEARINALETQNLILETENLALISQSNAPDNAPPGDGKA